MCLIINLSVEIRGVLRLYWFLFSFMVFRNKLCGMLQCTNIDGVNLPIIGTDRSGYEHRIGDTLCKLVEICSALSVPGTGTLSLTAVESHRKL